MDKNKMLPKEIRDKIDKYCEDIKSFCYTNSNTDKEFDRLVDAVYHRTEGIHNFELLRKYVAELNRNVYKKPAVHLTNELLEFFETEELELFKSYMICCLYTRLGQQQERMFKMNRQLSKSPE